MNKRHIFLTIGAVCLTATTLYPFLFESSPVQNAKPQTQNSDVGNAESVTTWVELESVSKGSQPIVLAAQDASTLVIEKSEPETPIAREFEHSVLRGETLSIQLGTSTPLNIVLAPTDAPLANEFRLTAIHQGKERDVEIEAPRFFIGQAVNQPNSQLGDTLTFASFVQQNGDFHGILKFDNGAIAEVYREPGTPHYIAKRYSEALLNNLDELMLDDGPKQDFSQLSNTFNGELSAYIEYFALDLFFSDQGDLPESAGAASAAHRVSNSNDKSFKGALGAQYRASLSHPQAFWFLQKRYFTEETTKPVTEQQFRDRYRRALSWLLYLNRWFENQIGYNYQAIEIVAALDIDPSYPGGYDLGPWARARRPDLKLDLVTNVRGKGGGGYSNGYNSNWVSDFGFLAHEHEHDFGAGHCSTFGSSSLFRPCGSAPYTRDHRAKVSQVYRSNKRWSDTPTRDPEQAPFAVDDNYYTPINEAITFDPTLNDVREQHWNPNRWRNETLTVVETGAVHPIGSGAVHLDALNQIQFVPAKGFEGSVKFSYTVKGSVGNNGEGWLHAGYVTIVVGEKSKESELDFGFNPSASEIKTTTDHIEAIGESVSFNPLGNDVGLGSNLIHRVTANKGMYEGEVSDDDSVGFHIVRVVNLTPEKGQLKAQTKQAVSGREVTSAYTGNMTFIPYEGATGIARVLYEVRDRNGNRATDIVNIYLDASGRPAINPASGTVEEHTLPGTSVLAMGSGQPNVRYKIVSGNFNGWFNIDPNTGKISVANHASIAISQKVKTAANQTNTDTKTIQVNQVKLVVEAMQQKTGVPRRNTAVATINIAARSNHPPKIANRLPLFTQVGVSHTPLWTLQPDDHENDAVEFSVGSNNRSPFTVDVSGKIVKHAGATLTVGDYALPIKIKETRSGGNVSQLMIPIKVANASISSTADLLASWSFDSDAVTATQALNSVTDHHLDLKGLSAAALVDGHRHKAMGLEGDTSYLALADTFPDLAAMNKGSISFWYHPDYPGQQSKTDEQIFFSAASYDGKQNLSFGHKDGALFYRVMVNGTMVAHIVTPKDVIQREWQLLSVVNDGTRTVLYRNDQMFESYSISTQKNAFFSALPTFDEFNLGRTFTDKNWHHSGESGHGQGYLRGMLDEFKIYRRAITLSDIQSQLDDPMVTIIGGVGSGRYAAGKTVTISQNIDGFFAWAGSVDVKDRLSETTSFVMPSANVMLEALPRNQVPTRGQLAYWPMDVIDGATLKNQSREPLTSSFVSQSGACTAPNTLADGYRNSAILFNGTCFVDMGIPPSLMGQLKSSATVSLWLKPEKTAGSHRYQTLISFGANASWVGLNHLYLDTTNQSIHYETRYHNASRQVESQKISSNAPVFDGDWHHVLLTSNPDMGTVLYVDGVVAGTIPTAAFMPNDFLTHNQLGRAKTTRSEYHYQGLMDEVRIFTGSVSNDEAFLLAQPNKLSLHAASGGGYFSLGARVSVKANTIAQHTLYQWLGDNRGIGAREEPSFTMGQQDRFVVATYIPEQYSYEKGLVARWALDEVTGKTAVESLTQTKGTYYQDMRTTTSVGVRGFAFSSDGAERQSLNITSSVDDFKSLTEGTIAGWVKIPAGNRKNMTLFSASYTGSWCHKTNLSVINGQLTYVQGCPNTSGYRAQSPTNIADNQWHHVAVTVSDQGTKLFIDGVLSATSAYTGFFANDSRINKANIGLQTRYNHEQVQGHFWHGQFDEVRLYNRPLSAQELAGLAKRYDVMSDKYYLAVKGGNGSGYYSPGEKVVIQAAPDSTLTHVQWAGDTQSLANQLASTVVTMPSTNLEVMSVVTEKSDRNGNGLQDYLELLKGASSDSKDTDGDGLSNTQEIALGTNPNHKDSDGDGIEDGKESEAGSNPLVDDQPPVIFAKDISLSATGETTEYALNDAYAIDARDGQITPVASVKGPFKPGRHVIRWSATDRSGNVATATSLLDVYPQVRLHKAEKLFVGGQRAKIPVTLTGDSPVYPVKLQIRASEASTLDSKLFGFINNGEVELKEGKVGYFEVELDHSVRVNEAKSILISLSPNQSMIKPVEGQASVVMGVYPDDLAIAHPTPLPSPLNLTGESQSGLKLHWSFDEFKGEQGIANQTGAAGEGALVGKPHNQLVPGAFSRSIQLAGYRSISGDSDTVSLMAELTRQKAFTFLMWVKIEKGDTGNYRILSTSSDSSWCEKLEMISIRGQAAFVMDCPRFDERNILSGRWINDGQWHLLAIAGNETETHFYVDGEKTNSQGSALNLLERARYFDLATTKRIGNPKQLKGELDELMIFNRVLDGSEINQIYQRYQFEQLRSVPLNASTGKVKGELGHTLAVGSIGQTANRNTALLTDAVLKQVTKALQPSAKWGSSISSSLEVLDSFYSVQVSRLNTSLVKWVVPSTMPLPVDTKVKMLVLKDNVWQWQLLPVANGEMVRSAPLNNGVCPEPNSREYIAGINQDDHCVEITLADDALYDLSRQSGHLDVIFAFVSSSRPVVLRVINGLGDGYYQEDQYVRVFARSPVLNQPFLGWEKSDVSSRLEMADEVSGLHLPAQDSVLMARYNGLIENTGPEFVREATSTSGSSKPQVTSSGGGMAIHHVLFLMMILVMNAMRRRTIRR